MFICIIFSSKSSKTSHLNHKNSDKRAKFSDKWSPGGTPPPSLPLASALLPDLLLIEETKLNPSFKTAETLLMKNYQNPLRRDRNEFGGGLMLYAMLCIVAH